MTTFLPINDSTNKQFNKKPEDRRLKTGVRDQLTGNKEQGRSQKSKDGKARITERTKGTVFYCLCLQH